MKKDDYKKGAKISGGILLIATLIIVILLSSLNGGSNSEAQFALILTLFTFSPVIIVSLVTFIIFVNKLRINK
jgi:hypothetical protein